MKNVIFVMAVVAAIAVATQSHAQEKGKFWIGGSVGFDNSDQSEPLNKTIRYSILPEFGYAFSDRWAAGIRVNIEQRKTNQGSGDGTSVSEVKENSLGFSPFVRYTALRWRAFSIFIDGGISYVRTKDDRKGIAQGEEAYAYNYIANKYSIFIDPGFSLRLSPCIALIGRLNFFNGGYEKYDYNRSNVNETYNDWERNYTYLNSPFNLESFTVGFTFRF